MIRKQTSHNQTDGDLLIEIRMLAPGELRRAAAILAHGMHDNPMHVKAFGTNPDFRQRRLLRFLDHLVAYVHSNGKVLGAYVHGELIGVLGMMEPGRCRPALIDSLRFASTIVASNPPAGVWRIHRWLAAWARNDPTDLHWHIGPLAVRSAYRRRGIGRRLMVRCCQHMDALAATAYLETDLEVNVAFYETLGFIVTKREFVLGVPNWFMSRSPSGVSDGSTCRGSCPGRTG
ncbi:GNAT family N-acetyltransferase [Pseudaminobacter sp. 19-2017]|uniref:GNAT family N-acetyltransferase n=1 Tax=Pseudaminobacter soli (ex Zhang et al. 2022) TaxID=2831468 RepID=A0A942E713_9HYPH|nr:GNAT family N-acetyltransferase [Pseudaminobacter soli]MBS3652510.1 GNAT family N-acetyltransferase [Pseudaminobacter soli]